MGFPGQEYWSGLPFSSPGDLPNPGIEPMSPASPTLQENSLSLSHLWNTWIDFLTNEKLAVICLWKIMLNGDLGEALLGARTMHVISLYELFPHFPQSGCTKLHFHQHSLRISLTAQLYWHLMLSDSSWPSNFCQSCNYEIVLFWDLRFWICFE